MKITKDIQDGVLVITINRPEAMNALDPEANRQLEAAWTEFERDDKLRVAILTGAGTKAFSAGADLKTAVPLFRERVLAGAEPLWSPGGGIARGFDLTKPIIAAVNGHAIAGGLEIALACDIRICSANATFSLTEAKLGLCPGAGGSQRLLHIIPSGFAMEMLLTGDPITAETAFEIGLVNRILDADKLMPAAKELALRVARSAPLAVKAIKRLAKDRLNVGFEQAMRLEHEAFVTLMRTADAKEGYTAFAERRLPDFHGQ